MNELLVQFTAVVLSDFWTRILNAILQRLLLTMSFLLLECDIRLLSTFFNP